MWTLSDSSEIKVSSSHPVIHWRQGVQCRRFLSLTDLITAQLHQPLRLDQSAVRPCCGPQPLQDDHSWLHPKVMENLPVSFQAGEVDKRWPDVSVTACWTTGMAVCLCVHVWDSVVCSLQGQSWRCWVPLCGAVDVSADPPATASWTELLLNQKVLKSSYSSSLKEQQTPTVLRFAFFSWQHDVIRLCSDWPTRQSTMESVRKLQIYGCSRVNNNNNNKQSDITEGVEDTIVWSYRRLQFDYCTLNISIENGILWHVCELRKDIMWAWSRSWSDIRVLQATESQNLVENLHESSRITFFSYCSSPAQHYRAATAVT